MSHNPYRVPGKRDEYNDDELSPAYLIAIPRTQESKEHRQDRFSWLNLIKSGLLVEGPNDKVAICFKNIAYVYPSFWELQRDLRNKWAQREVVKPITSQIGLSERA